jgi:hypothetical protein
VYGYQWQRCFATGVGCLASFTYQWRRCDAAGVCPDIPGATSQTYVVTAADSRTALRVHVVATNAAGPSGSISPATPVIP